MSKNSSLEYAVSTKTATVWDNNMNMIIYVRIIKNESYRKLYIGDGGQVTTISGCNLLGGPERSQIP